MGGHHMGGQLLGLQPAFICSPLFLPVSSISFCSFLSTLAPSPPNNQPVNCKLPYVQQCWPGSRSSVESLLASNNMNGWPPRPSHAHSGQQLSFCCPAITGTAGPLDPPTHGQQVICGVWQRHGRHHQAEGQRRVVEQLVVAGHLQGRRSGAAGAAGAGWRRCGGACSSPGQCPLRQGAPEAVITLKPTWFKEQRM